MKGEQSMKKGFIAIAFIAFLFTSCADSFLSREPAGSTVTQTLYDKLSSDKLENSLNGLYSMIYTMNTSRHDEFGQRSIDLWGDILCADIAVTDKTYGWLYTDEQMQTTSRTGTIWAFYYDILRNANIVIRNINKDSDDLMAKVAKSGYPSTAAKGTYDIAAANYALWLAQAFAMRAYCYSNLVRWYTPVEESTYMTGYTIKTYPCCPLYTETNFESPQPLSTSEQIYNQVFKDLANAIKLFEEFGALYQELEKSEYARDSKLKINIDVARGLLAYAYLNAAPYYAVYGEEKAYYQKALDYATDVMKNGKFQIIKNENLYTTGFNNVEDPSWMWGQHVVTETAGGLKSWFGQVDIHSYSYAWAGDTKVIDDNLKQEIMKLEWDGRIKWFNDGSVYSKFKDCPDGKFFSAASPVSTEDDDIDREWLSDNVFMRYESMYLIAAEASYFLGDAAGAVTNYLKPILEQRLNPEYPDSQADFNTYINGLAGEDVLKAITYNWRVEMWGEGYGLQTFRRLTKETKRGSNHDYRAGASIKAGDPNYNLNIPTSEATYNPNI